MQTSYIVQGNQLVCIDFKRNFQSIAAGVGKGRRHGMNRADTTSSAGTRVERIMGEKKEQETSAHVVLKVDERGAYRSREHEKETKPTERACLTPLHSCMPFYLIISQLARSRLFLVSASIFKVVLTSMVTVSRVELGVLLLVRVAQRGSDARFDETRDNFFRFLGFWIFQMVSTVEEDETGMLHEREGEKGEGRCITRFQKDINDMRGVNVH